MLFEGLDDYFRALEADDAFSGVALITHGETEVFSGAYGFASRAWAIANTLDIRFDTASITKLFTAVSALQCIERGAFSLDTSVIDYLGLTGTTISRAVTVYHLLTHTSGIADDADEEAGERYEDIFKDKPNYSILRTVDFLPQFVHKPPNFPPGQGCRYCNVGFILLGLMIEQGSGLSYTDYVQRRIFDRIAMRDSGFFRKDHVVPRLAEGSDPIYADDGKIAGWRRNIYAFPPIGSPDGGAYVTARDLNRFLRAVQAGELLSPALTAEFLSPKVDHSPYRTWMHRIGYALEFYVSDAGEVEFYQKEGINVGVSGYLRYYPARDVSVVMLSNMEEGVWQPIWKVHEAVTA